jgi:hypothetical protein
MGDFQQTYAISRNMYACLTLSLIIGSCSNTSLDKYQQNECLTIYAFKIAVRMLKIQKKTQLMTDRCNEWTKTVYAKKLSFYWHFIKK